MEGREGTAAVAAVAVMHAQSFGSGQGGVCTSAPVVTAAAQASASAVKNSSAYCRRTPAAAKPSRESGGA